MSEYVTQQDLFPGDADGSNRCPADQVLDSISEVEKEIAGFIRAEAERIRDGSEKAREIHDLVEVGKSACECLPKLILLEIATLLKLDAVSGCCNEFTM